MARSESVPRHRLTEDATLERTYSIVRTFRDKHFLQHILVNVLVSLVSGLLALLFIKDISSSLIVMLVMICMTLLLELRGKLSFEIEKTQTVLEQTKDELKAVSLDHRATLSQVGSRVAAAIELHQAIIDGPTPLDAIHALLKSYGTVQAQGDALFQRHAVKMVEACVSGLQGLAQGRLDVEPQNLYRLTEEFIRAAKSEIFATSLFRTADFWTASESPAYLQANIEAMGKGVKITRVFILENRSDLERKIKNRVTVRQLINEQLDVGIDVRVALERDLKAEARRDMAIIDGDPNGYVAFLEMKTRAVYIYAKPTSEHREARHIRKQIEHNSSSASEFLRYNPPPRSRVTLRPDPRRPGE